MKLNKFEKVIEQAYLNRERSLMWLAQGLQLEAAELVTLLHKKEGYKKEYTRRELISELGDCMNFLVAFSQHSLISLEEIFDANAEKLKLRGWLVNINVDPDFILLNNKTFLDELYELNNKRK